MTSPLIDPGSLRAELRTLSRGSLLIIAERAVELVPAPHLDALLGDFVQFAEHLAEASRARVCLLDEVRAFYVAAKAGMYYETVAINNHGQQKQSNGTDAFIADFDRLLHACIRASENAADASVTIGFELLFGLHRHINKGNDDVIFFADDSDASALGTNWTIAMPAYICSLARTTPPEEFADAIHAAIEDFTSEDRMYYLTVARNIVNDAQRLALDTLAVGK